MCNGTQKVRARAPRCFSEQGLQYEFVFVAVFSARYLPRVHQSTFSLLRLQAIQLAVRPGAGGGFVCFLFEKQNTPKGEGMRAALSAASSVQPATDGASPALAPLDLLCLQGAKCLL